MAEETKVAVIDLATGLVENIAVVRDGDGSTAPTGFRFVPSDEAGIGDSWDGEQIIKASQQIVEVPLDAGSQALPAEKADSASRLDALEARIAALEAKFG